MNKLWLTLITQNREQDIEEMTRDTYEYFDGIVACVNQPSDDETFDILESRKKAGHIIKRPFVRHHAHMMNEFLFSGVIQNGDAIVILDSSDRIQLEWLKTLREEIFNPKNNEVAGYYIDRVYVVKYFDGLEFCGGVHWGLNNIRGTVVNLGAENKKKYIINTRESSDENITRSAIINPIKYFVEYPSPSQTELLYRQFGDAVWYQRENQRLLFRVWAQEKFGECTVRKLVNFLQTALRLKTLPEFIVNYIHDEVNMCDLIRFYILKQDFLNEINKNRFDWSFKDFYYGGVEHQPHNNYIGLFNKLNLSIGKPRE